MDTVWAVFDGFRSVVGVVVYLTVLQYLVWGVWAWFRERRR